MCAVDKYRGNPVSDSWQLLLCFWAKLKIQFLLKVFLLEISEPSFHEESIKLKSPKKKSGLKKGATRNLGARKLAEDFELARKTSDHILYLIPQDQLRQAWTAIGH